MKTVNILGTAYTIVVKMYDEEEAFARRSIDGFCDGYVKEIVLCDMSTYKGWEHETDATKAAVQKATLRHEIVHAFFNESGLMGSAAQHESPWSKNEEMVDWIAIQGLKLYTAWVEADAV